jgi:hypothetical protein
MLKFSFLPVKEEKPTQSAALYNPGTMSSSHISDTNNKTNYTSHNPRDEFIKPNEPALAYSYCSITVAPHCQIMSQLGLKKFVSQISRNLCN